MAQRVVRGSFCLMNTAKSSAVPTRLPLSPSKPRSRKRNNSFKTSSGISSSNNCSQGLKCSKSWLIPARRCNKCKVIFDISMIRLFFCFTISTFFGFCKKKEILSLSSGEDSTLPMVSSAEAASVLGQTSSAQTAGLIESDATVSNNSCHSSSTNQG